METWFAAGGLCETEVTPVNYKCNPINNTVNSTRGPRIVPMEAPATARRRLPTFEFALFI